MFKFLLRAASLFFSVMWALCFQKHRHLTTASDARQFTPNTIGPSTASLCNGHELSDANPKVIAALATALFSVIFVTMAAVGWMYRDMYSTSKAMPVRSIQENFKDAPHTETGITADWKTIDALSQRRLDGYEWADEAHQSLHIPIERAMELVATEGLSARKGQPPSFPPSDREKLPVSDSEKTPEATKSHVH